MFRRLGDLAKMGRRVATGILIGGAGAILGLLYAVIQLLRGQTDLVANFLLGLFFGLVGIAIVIGIYVVTRWVWGHLPAEAHRIVGIVAVLVITVGAVAGLYAWIQLVRGNTNIDANLVNGLLYVFIGLAVFVIVAPTVLRLYQEDLAKGADMKSEEWMTRLRTLITVSLTIVLLVFALTWFFSPEKLEVPTTSVSGSGTTNNTTALHPFVRAFVDVYTVVIAFYFPTAAAQSIATTLKPTSNAAPPPRR